METVLAEACSVTGARVNEFTVAPVVDPSAGLPHHQWLIEFGTLPVDMQKFASLLDEIMCKKNSYYNDLVTGHVLEPLHICSLPRGTFRKYQASIGKLGGQNKVTHLSDSREIADGLINLKIR